MSKPIPERAVELFMEGFNCSQAVFGAFAETVGMTEAQAVRLSAALGAGVARMRDVCGAVTGGMLAIGWKYGAEDGADQVTKSACYARGQKICLSFQEKFGTLICRDLLKLKPLEGPSPIPTPRTAEFYQTRPCAQFVYEMARLVEEELKDEE